MRNRFFPLRIADYVTQTERRSIRINNVPVERDYNFGKEEEGAIVEGSTAPFGGMNAFMEEHAGAERLQQQRSRARGVEVEKLSVERSLELLDIFVHPRLDFYRQPLPPVVEEKEEAPAAPAVKERMRTASSAAADLLEARTAVPKVKPAADAGPQGIYGSVSANDVLVAIRAATATNDEAARIVVREEDVVFLDEKVGRAVKFVGDFTVEIGVKGAEKGIKRTVRVIPQEAV